MAGKKKFLLRIDDVAFSALERWAADELRSVNSQIEFLLYSILRKEGRFPKAAERREHEPDKDKSL